jgi:hypothetical protein
MHYVRFIIVKRCKFIERQSNAFSLKKPPTIWHLITISILVIQVTSLPVNLPAPSGAGALKPGLRPEGLWTRREILSPYKETVRSHKVLSQPE